MTENLPKLVKYIFPTSKELTEVWSLRYRDLPFTIISVGLIVNLCTLYSYYSTVYKTYKTYKSPVGDKYIQKTTQFRILILLMISRSQETCREVTNALWFHALRYAITVRGQCVMFFYMRHRIGSKLGSLINDHDWAITLLWSIWETKLNTHSNVGGSFNNLSARNRRASGNEWPGIICVRYHCPCRSCWLPRVWNGSIGRERGIL